MEILKCEGVEKTYGSGGNQAVALAGIDLTVEKGEFVAIIGASGSGKSTLLRCINMLEEPTAGKIYYRGEVIQNTPKKVSEYRAKVGMVFQSFNLFPQYTAMENVMLAKELLAKEQPDYKAKRKEIHEEIAEQAGSLLDQMGLSDRKNNYPHQLSGGQCQRVAIARALALQPDILCFDEPTSALDPELTGEVLKVIRQLAKEHMTMIIVTHEMKFARNVSTRIFYMDQGEIYEDGTPEQIFEHPKRERTRIFIRQLKVLHVEKISRDFDFPAFMTRLEEFGRKQQFSQKQIYAMQLVVEEALMQKLLPAAWEAEERDLSLDVEYSERENLAQMRFSYNGPSFHPFGGEEDLSVRMIKGMSKEMEHKFVDGMNQFIISI